MGWVLRGLVAGLVAGVLAGLLALAIAEPSIDRAIAFEELQSALVHENGVAHEHDDGDGLVVSRQGQKAGLILATGLWGIALGLILALAFRAVRSRVAGAREGVSALMLSAGLFLALVLVPFLKYPPSPPGVGDPDTIGRRTLLYIAMVAISAAALVAAAQIARRVPPRLGPLTRPVAGAAAFCAIAAVAGALMPTVAEIPAEFPADLLWDFRLSSLITQAALWGLLGAVFAVLADRARERAG
jgi:predicted cobalt transporter CbtA